MSHYAKIDKNNKVVKILVIEQDVIDSGLFGDPKSWIKTSYNTHGGEHSLGGKPLRKNYAGLSYTYDKKRKAFIPPKPYDSWVLNEDTCQWEPPIPMPTKKGSFFQWNEDAGFWIESRPKG
jgi:hypothetical protein